MKANKEYLTYFARVFWIIHELSTSRYPNARKIAEHFEISNRTAQRTLEFMRDQLRLPMEYSAQHRGWYYTEPTYSFTGIEITEGELLVRVLAKSGSRAQK
jgi:predicted DNA-binding transcriptional regulator YafY